MLHPKPATLSQLQQRTTRYYLPVKAQLSTPGLGHGPLVSGSFRIPAKPMVQRNLNGAREHNMMLRDIA